MEKLYIICVDDQREVLSTIAKDLAVFENDLIIEECESATEAEELIDEIDSEGDFVALIISDHVMPGKSGVDFLSDVNKDERFPNTQKILLTGLATHQDTIEAINSASINQYLEKPWNKEELIKSVKKLLTRFILKTGLDYQKYLPLTDQETLFEILKKQG
ncbi:response regulator [Flexithrix dorotheae]|uniref:response regulator n=1 Tax=Flexithrix dorotheae TaxID=70993 RepID=UPI000371CA42|nr:response regulator [Flexithrix dorotheae]